VRALWDEIKKKELMHCHHRIAAGAILIHEGKILLVRYPGKVSSYLVAPGGAIQDGESLSHAAEREVKEETSVDCKTRIPIMMENIRAREYQMLKVWYLSDYISGSPVMTEEARKEGIIQVAWFRDDELSSEIVFPEIIQRMKIAGVSNLSSDIIDSSVRYADF
jgi:ADP-ribose pyrophosphatase YjhB (NUDIX family)